MGIGRYSKRQESILSFPALAVMSLLAFLGQLWDRDSLFFVFRSGCPGRGLPKKFYRQSVPREQAFSFKLLGFYVWEALATLQYSVSPAEMLSYCCAVCLPATPRPCTNHSIKDTHFCSFPPLPRHLPFPSLFSSSKKGNHKYWFLFSFFLKNFHDSAHTTSSDVKGDGESLESWSG